MAIRKHPTKGQGWWILVISQGRNKRQRTVTFNGTEAAALAFEADLRGVPQESAEQKPYDVLARFLSWYRLESAPATVKAAEKSLPRIIEILSNKPVSLFRQADYTRYKQKRDSDGVTRKTVNIELGYWRALLNFTRDQLQIQIGELPKLYTKKQTRPPAKQPLTPDETARLLAQLHGDKKTIAMLYAWCGLRRDEALYLRRSNIDTDAGLINVLGKGDKGRIVPIIGDELKQRLATACTHYPKKRRGKQLDPSDHVRDKHPDEYLFICARTGQPYTNIKKGLKAAAARAGISKPVHNHLLRHSAATSAIRAGVGVRSLQVLLGHGDIRMTEIYSHMAADMLLADGNKIDHLHQVAKQASEMSESSIGKKSNVIKIDRKPRR